MRKVFSKVYSLLSVNSIRIYAGGLHSWAVLDDIMPKKDHFKPHKSPGEEDSHLISGDETMNQLAN